MNFFKGITSIKESKSSLSIKKLESVINTKYEHEITKIENICKTAEITLSNMLYDMIEENKGN